MARTDTGRATFRAAPNIALVKYWGVRTPELGLPFNSSLSVTLGRMHTETTVRFAPELAADSLRLNGASTRGPMLTDVSRFLDRVRGLARLSTRAEVRTANNFPTASGLASSASGFAALAGAATRAAGLHLSARALSRLARLGSGSASRSIYGGFVEWRAGHREDGRDCFARPLYPASHWPAFRDLVVIIASAPVKKVRSADAMQSSVRTSPYFQARQREIPRRIVSMRRAIGRRDACTLFPLIMEECDSFRKVCETTSPSLDYLTEDSRRAIDEVRSLNEEVGRPIAAYTHDAGAHLHIFTLAADAGMVRRRLAHLRGVQETLLLRPGPPAEERRTR
ncbi:MAG: diphosphomevalonate decarboxylase [Thermoplasmata archaeon]